MYKQSNKTSQKKYGWHGAMTSSGKLGLSLYFEEPEGVDADLALGATAESIVQSVAYMQKQGYIPPNARLMSSREIAEAYNFTRQYWEKLMREGKLPYYQTAAGRITVDLWVEGYLQNREKVDEYVTWQKSAVRRALAAKNYNEPIDCPKCGKPTLSYARNQHEVNGSCDSGCGFRFSTST